MGFAAAKLGWRPHRLSRRRSLAPSEDTERLGAAAAKAGAYVVMGCNEIDPRPEVSTIYIACSFSTAKAG